MPEKIVNGQSGTPVPTNLTDSEIVKALEICSTYKGKCTDCPAFVKVDRSNCKKVLLGAVEIINRLEVRIGIYETCNARKDEAIKHLEAENERLKKFKAYFENLCGYDLEILGVTEDGDSKPYDEFYKTALKEMTGVNCETVL